MPVAQASGYGIVEPGPDLRVLAFVEKPDQPRASRIRPGHAYASMGVYVFGRRFLLDCLEADAKDPSSAHDFGHNIVPRAIREGRVYAHVFRDLSSGAPAYWRDIGTIDSYWAAHMDLLREPAQFELFGSVWPVWTPELCGRPARITHTARIRSSIVSRDCDVAAADVSASVLSAGSSVGAYSRLCETVLLPNVAVGRSCRLERVVVDSGCTIPDHTVISPSDLPARSAFHVSPNGIVLVTANALAKARPTKVA